MSSGERNFGQLGNFSFKDWILSIPPITRFLFFGSALLTATVALFGLGPWAYQLWWSPIVSKFQILRLIGTFFYAPQVGIPLLIHFYFLYQYSYQAETSVFYGRLDEYAWMLFVVCCAILVQTIIVPYRFFQMQKLIAFSVFYSPALVIAIVHVWGFSNRDVFVSLYGMIRIPAKYLSLVLLGLEFIMSKGVVGIDGIQGILAGHFYYFMRNEYPTMPNGGDLLQTPARFSKFVYYLDEKFNNLVGLSVAPEPVRESTRSGNFRDTRGFSRSQEQQGSSSWRSGITNPRMRPSGHDWGQGRTLGSS